MPPLRSTALSVLCLALSTLPLAAQGGSFGNAVVVTDDEMVVTEPTNSFRPGVVYTYERSGDGWRETSALMAPDAERMDGFGAALARSGSTLFVAQRGVGIHVFERTASGWSFDETLMAGSIEGLDPGCNNYGYCGADFGLTMVASDDWLLVGEPGVATDVAGLSGARRRAGPDDPPAPAGRVVALQRSGDSWVPRGSVASPDPASGDGFGASLALDGDLLLVGAPEAGRSGSDSDGAGSIDGAGRVFTYRMTMDRWDFAGELNASAEVDGAYGKSVALDGSTALVGAPGSGGGYGAAYLFQADEGGSWSEVPTRLTAPAGQEGDHFGASVAISDGALWIGAPVARGIDSGMSFVFEMDNDGEPGMPLRIRYSESETNTQDAFGYRAASGGGIAAITASGLDHQAGGVFVFERDGSGAWAERSRLISPPDALGAVMGAERRCEEGHVELFDCEDIELLSYIPISLLRADGNSRGVRANDNWGWTDSQTGREYALVGRNDGTSFVDITDPSNPVLVGDLPKTPDTPRSQLWRDIKTYQNHAYIVADGAGRHGMQIFDLTRLRDVADPPVVFEPDVLYRGEGSNVVESSHNVIINEETGFAYLTDRGCAGMHIVDIREPLEPDFIGCTDPGGTHDAQCLNYRGPDERYQGREICLRMSGDRFQISDVTDKDNPVELARTSHPNPAYMHQGWVTEDHRYFYMDDESDVIAGNVETTRTLIWDLSDLEDPILAHEFMGSMPASAHNLYIKDNLAYQANYRYGLHILDISDPLNPVEVGHFDTSPYQEGPGFAGAWSTYPFFESGSVIVTSMQEGLFVLKKRSRPIS